MTDRAARDVIVVGGGMAGLAAAHALSAYDVQVLECEARPGGRVKTVAARGGTLDLGACIAFNSRLLPEGVAPPSNYHRERGPLGIQLGARRGYADSAWSAVAAVGLPEPTVRALAGLRTGELELGDVPGPGAAVARALFQQIHPGDMSAYSRLRQGDAWLDWYPDHWTGGNGRLVEAYLDVLGAELVLDATVTRLVPDAGAVQVEYTRDGLPQQATGRAVVVATPATVARDLVEPDDPELGDFVRQVRYGRYTVVAFALDAPIEDFRVMVTPEASFAFALQQRGPAADFAALVCYYDDARASAVDGVADSALAEATARELAGLGLIELDLHTTPWWVQRWPLSGTILDDTFTASRRSGPARASHRVFLAGDYLAPTPAWGYGLENAVDSGRAAGELVGRLLAGGL